MAKVRIIFDLLTNLHYPSPLVQARGYQKTLDCILVLTAIHVTQVEWWYQRVKSHKNIEFLKEYSINYFRL
jgi:hypothetical protein